jgi:hypothetical protein
VPRAGANGDNGDDEDEITQIHVDAGDGGDRRPHGRVDSDGRANRDHTQAQRGPENENGYRDEEHGYGEGVLPSASAEESGQQPDRHNDTRPSPATQRGKTGRAGALCNVNRAQPGEHRLTSR